LSELISNPEHIKYFSFKCWHFNGLSDIQKSTAGSLPHFIANRNGQLCLPPLLFSSQQLSEIIDCLCTSRLHALFLSLCNFCHVCLHITCVGFMYEYKKNIIIIICLINDNKVQQHNLITYKQNY